VNYDLPNVSETYVHRIGRTGRANASGVALSFCDKDERPYLRDIEKLIKQAVPRMPEHQFMDETPEETENRPPRQPRSNNRSGGHKRNKHKSGNSNFRGKNKRNTNKPKPRNSKSNTQ